MQNFLRSKRKIIQTEMLRRIFVALHLFCQRQNITEEIALSNSPPAAPENSQRTPKPLESLLPNKGVLD